MDLALVPVAPYVLLGFAAVTTKAPRTGRLPRQPALGSVISIGNAAPVHAACRVEFEPDPNIDLAMPQHRTRPTGVTVLRLDVGFGGDIYDVDILTTSGFPVLDSAALTLVRTARIDAAPRGKYRATIVFTE